MDSDLPSYEEPMLLSSRDTGKYHTGYSQRPVYEKTAGTL